MAAQKGLGKGLGALFGDFNEQAEQPSEGTVTLPLQKIEPNPLQPRKTFDQEELASQYSMDKEKLIETFGEDMIQYAYITKVTYGMIYDSVIVE